MLSGNRHLEDDQDSSMLSIKMCSTSAGGDSEKSSIVQKFNQNKDYRAIEIAELSPQGQQ